MPLVVVCLANKMNQMGLAQIKEIEKKYECIIADKATKHQQDIEVVK